jgi:hypothetical protein
VSGKGKAVAQEDLKRKEEAIQLMQRKIAELEQRKAKQGKTPPRSPSAPTQSLVSSAAVSPPALAVGAANTTAEIDRLIDDTRAQVEEGRVALAEAKAVEAGVMGSGAGDLQKVTATDDAGRDSSIVSNARMEQVRQRRAELQSILQESDAQVERIRREQEEREALIQRALEQKQKLMQELNGLETEPLEPPISEVEPKQTESKGPTKTVDDAAHPMNAAAAAPEILERVTSPVDVTSTKQNGSAIQTPAEAGHTQGHTVCISPASDSTEEAAADVDPARSLSPSPISRSSRGPDADDGRSMDESIEEGEITDNSLQEPTKSIQLASTSTPGVGVPTEMAAPAGARAGETAQPDVVMKDVNEPEPTVSLPAPEDMDVGSEEGEVTNTDDVPSKAGITRGSSPASVESDPYEPPEPVGNDDSTSFMTASSAPAGLGPTESPSFSPAAPGSTEVELALTTTAHSISAGKETKNDEPSEEVIVVGKDARADDPLVGSRPRASTQAPSSC